MGAFICEGPFCLMTSIASSVVPPLSRSWLSRAIEAVRAEWGERTFFTLTQATFDLEAFLTLYATWEADEKAPENFHVVAFVSSSDWNGAWQQPDFIDQVTWDAFIAQKPVAVPGFHRLSLADDRVVLTLVYDEADAVLSKMTLGWDSLFWTGENEQTLRGLLKLSNEKARVYAETFSEDEATVLKRSAFRVEVLEGYGSAILMAPRKKGGYRKACDRRALVIGAGLAGANAAYALQKAGWRVFVIDEAPVPGARASALAWGILHPHFSRDDNILSRMSREGFFSTRTLLKQLEAQTGEMLFADAGCLQMAHSDAIFSEWDLAREKGMPFVLPADYARFVSRDEADRLSGVSLHRGGWWFNQAGMVRAGAFCRALIREAQVPYLGNTPVVRLEKHDGEWAAIGEFGQEIARAPHVVVACATDAGNVLGIEHLTLDALRGRITLLRDTDLATLKAPVSGEGYISNLPDGFCGVGATYENDQLAAWDEERAHTANLEKLATIMRETEDVVVTGAYQGVRAVGLGRLPYVGPVCDEKAWIATTKARGNCDLEHPPVIEGLWVMAGMGSRGVSMSTLCARILVSWMDGTPMPIDNRVVRCLTSARSVKKFVETL